MALFDWKEYYGHLQPKAPAPADEIEPTELTVTGDALIEKVFSAIVDRQSVLLTGPRGCGKTYCADRAIELAVAVKKICGVHFLQGNREIARDYLSEDSLFVEGKEIVPNHAIAVRMANPDAISPDKQRAFRSQHPAWPALLSMGDFETSRSKSLEELWPVEAWSALFLDEINRFSDGFLDSLLSLTEERKVVRRGRAYLVPLVLVATANPPGYDSTAKKLSPPLQARIGRSYRLAQPPLDVLVHTVIGSVPDDPHRPAMSLSLRYRVAGATLCLWGQPDADRRAGCAFLTPGTRRLLELLMSADEVLRVSMTTLGSLVQFGPDARAARDWVLAATALAKAERASEVSQRHLLATCVEVLPHRLRESFNEGNNPQAMSNLVAQVRIIVDRILNEPVFEQLLVLPYAGVLQKLNPASPEPSPLIQEIMASTGQMLPKMSAEQALFAWMSQLGDHRSSKWVHALDKLPKEVSGPSPFQQARETWVQAVRGDRLCAGLLDEKGEIVVAAEREWLRRLLDSHHNGQTRRHAYRYVLSIPDG